MKIQKIAHILYEVDNGGIALPEFQRGYVWTRDQVRGLFSSLYRRNPVGGLLMWLTESKSTIRRGDTSSNAGSVQLLLDGQQRITSLYGVARGKPPKFFQGSTAAFTGLRFGLDNETFAFYQESKMKDDPRWVDVTDIMRRGAAGVADYARRLTQQDIAEADLTKYYERLMQLLGILEIEFYIEEVTGAEKSLDMVVDIFNLVNSAGTKLSKGDLALAKICAEWPDARNTMNAHIENWKKSDYVFNLDWLLRSVNTVLTGEAKFSFLHNQSAEDVQDGLKRAVANIETCLRHIDGRLGLDHNQVLFGRFAFPVMVRYLDQKAEPLSSLEIDKLLFWYVQAAMWGRFSGSTETYIDQDLGALEGDDGGLDSMLENLRLWHGGLRVEPGHFAGWSLGARFYPVLYMLTRMGAAKDWGNGLPLKANMLGKHTQLEMHHIFPKAQLYKHGYKRAEVNALANFCFQTKDTNLEIGDRLPEEYFRVFEERHPGCLASQWIPQAPRLWKIENYLEFLEARRELLAAEANARMAELLHGDLHWLEGPPKPRTARPLTVVGGISSDEEDQELNSLNDWVASVGLLRGMKSYEFADPDSGEQLAAFDLAWPTGVQEERTEPVVVLLNEEAETIALANHAGFRCFTSSQDFKNYVTREILAETAVTGVDAQEGQ